MKYADETAKDADERERLDRLLDAALAATFPASDPIALGTAELPPAAKHHEVGGAGGQSCKSDL